MTGTSSFAIVLSCCICLSSARIASADLLILFKDNSDTLVATQATGSSAINFGKRYDCTFVANVVGSSPDLDMTAFRFSWNYHSYVLADKTVKATLRSNLQPGGRLAPKTADVVDSSPGPFSYADAEKYFGYVEGYNDNIFFKFGKSVNRYQCKSS